MEFGNIRTNLRMRWLFSCNFHFSKTQRTVMFAITERLLYLWQCKSDIIAECHPNFWLHSSPSRKELKLKIVGDIRSDRLARAMTVLKAREEWKLKLKRKYSQTVNLLSKWAWLTRLMSTRCASIRSIPTESPCTWWSSSWRHKITLKPIGSTKHSKMTTK